MTPKMLRPFSFASFTALTGATALCLACGGSGSDPDASGGSSSGGTSSSGGSGGTSSGGSSATGGSETGGNGASCGEPLVTLDGSEPKAEGLAEVAPDKDFDYLRGIAATADDLYVLADSGLFKVSGSSLEATLVSDEVVGKLSIYGAQARTLALSATHAYFPLSSGIGRVDLASGTLETLYDKEDISYVVLSESLVFFGVPLGENRGIYSLPLAGGEAPTLVTDLLEGRSFELTADTIYGANENGYLSKVPLAGGSLTIVSDHTDGILPSVEAVRIADEKLYWTEDSGRDYVCSLPDCGSPLALYAYSSRSGFSVRGDRVYGIAEGSLPSTTTLGWRSTDGTSCGVFVDGQFPNTVSAFETTSGFVFFAAAGGLYRLPLAD